MLSWTAPAVDDLVGLAMELDVHTVKEVLDNTAALVHEPRPVTARPVRGPGERYYLHAGAVVVVYEIVADAVVRPLRLLPKPKDATS
jgi:hypothetical protein